MSERRRFRAPHRFAGCLPGGGFAVVVALLDKALALSQAAGTGLVDKDSKSNNGMTTQ